MKKARTQRIRVEIITSGVVQSIHVPSKLSSNHFRCCLNQVRIESLTYGNSNQTILSKVRSVYWALRWMTDSGKHMLILFTRKCSRYWESWFQTVLWLRRQNMFFDLYWSATESPCQQSIKASQPKSTPLIWLQWRNRVFERDPRLFFTI